VPHMKSTRSRNLTDLPGVDHLRELSDLRSRSAMKPYLGDAVILRGRIHHSPPFEHGKREGLLAVNILARLTRRHEHHSVPMVWSTDRYRVHVLVVEKFAIVLIANGGAYGGGLLPRQIKVIVLQIADRDGS